MHRLLYKTIPSIHGESFNLLFHVIAISEAIVRKLERQIDYHSYSSTRHDIIFYDLIFLMQTKTFSPFFPENEPFILQNKIHVAFWSQNKCPVCMYNVHSPIFCRQKQFNNFINYTKHDMLDFVSHTHLTHILKYTTYHASVKLL